MTQIVDPVNIEKRAFAMFRQQNLATDFKQLIVLLVYCKIKDTPDVSEIMLKKYMQMEHNISGGLVDGALSSLVSTQCFSAVKSWYYSNNKNVMRYVVKDDSVIIPWINDLLQARPEWRGYVDATIR